MKSFSLRTGWVLLQMFFSAAAIAGPFDSRFDDMTSVSQSYGARDARIHPAALAFDSELNGSSFQTILNTAVRPGVQDDYGLGLSYGSLGFNWERTQGSMNRYQFSLGGAISQNLFVGHRLSLYRFSNPALEYDSWDSGIQFRPHRQIAFGFLVNNWNTPLSGIQKVPAEFILGTTARLTSFLDLSFDIRTLSGPNEFLKKFQSQVATRWTPWRGVHLSAGYHSVREWQFGLEFDFDYGSVVVNGVPSSANQALSIGMTSGSTTQQTVLAPATVLHIQLDSSLAEEGNEASLFRAERPSLLSILDKLRKVPESGNIQSVLLEIRSFPLGMAAAQELHQALLDLRKQGIQIEAHLGQAGLKEYIVAAGADKIHMEPEGELRFLGLRAERYYIKGTLDKIGVEGQFLARGKYKSAPEMFTRTESSPTSKQVTNEELDRAETQVLALLNKARGISTKQWKQMLQNALYGSKQAVDEKIVDGVLAFRVAKQKLDDQLRTTRSSERKRNELALPDRVAVVVAEGNILQSRTSLLSLGGQLQLTPESFQKKIKRALRDSRTKAIVVRVSSPGGEVMASQELAEIIKDAKQQKPVIVSMGDVAASGGYFMSAPADKIFAGPLTLTGSIGVFLGKFHFEGLYKWLKLNKEVIAHSPYPGLYSEDRPWNAQELQVLTRRLNTYYESFVAFVAAQRKLSPEKAEEAAQGRVWLGDQAKQLKLSDELGGYQEALNYAASAARTPPEEMEYWEVQASAGFFPWSNDFADAHASSAVSDIVGKSAANQLLWSTRLRENPYLYLSPVEKLE